MSVSDHRGVERLLPRTANASPLPVPNAQAVGAVTPTEKHKVNLVDRDPGQIGGSYPWSPDSYSFSNHKDIDGMAFAALER